MGRPPGSGKNQAALLLVLEPGPLEEMFGEAPRILRHARKQGIASLIIVDDATVMDVDDRLQPRYLASGGQEAIKARHGCVPSGIALPGELGAHKERECRHIADARRKLPVFVPGNAFCRP